MNRTPAAPRGHGAGPDIGGAFNRDAKISAIRKRKIPHLGHDVALRRLPAGVADVGLVHHVLPFAAGKCVVVVIAYFLVLLEKFADLCSFGVGAGAALLDVERIAAGGNVEIIKIGAGDDGMKDEFVVRVLFIPGDDLVELLCPGGELIPGGGDLLGFPVVDETIGVRADHLRLAPGVVLGVLGDHVGDFGGMLGAELAGRPTSTGIRRSCPCRRLRGPSPCGGNIPREFPEA